MSIKGSFYATSGTDRPYVYSDFNENFKDVFTNGIATRGETLTTQMEVSGMTGTMKSQVNLGVAYVNGIRSEVYSAAEEITHNAADVTNPRLDLVCLEVYPAPAGGVRNSRIVKITGTPAATPVAPDASLVQTDDQYQYPLAEVLIPAGETNADNFTYTDRREICTVPMENTAANSSVADAGGYFTGTNVETVLQEIGALLQYISYSEGQLWFTAPGCTPLPLLAGVTDANETPPAGTFPKDAQHIQYDEV